MTSAGQVEGDLGAMRMKFAVVVVILLSGMSLSLRAHHSFTAEFDATKPFSFTGTVTSMEWTNPHVWIHVDVKQPDGTVENWAIEGGTPGVLFRRGFTNKSLLAGTVVQIDGYKAKDGANRANGRNVTLPNGQTLFFGTASSDAPPELADPGTKAVPPKQ